MPLLLQPVEEEFYEDPDPTPSKQATPDPTPGKQAAFICNVVRKPTFCLWENKGADQLCSNCEADQHLCFRYTDSTILYFVNPKFTTSSRLLCLNISDYVRPILKPYCWFSHNGTHLKCYDVCTYITENFLFYQPGKIHLINEDDDRFTFYTQ